MDDNSGYILFIPTDLWRKIHNWLTVWFSQQDKESCDLALSYGGRQLFCFISLLYFDAPPILQLL